MKLVEVVWYDHWSLHGGWREVADVKCELEVCKTVGYLVKENKNGYMIAGTVDTDNGMINSIQFRARKLVKSIRVLK